MSAIVEVECIYSACCPECFAFGPQCGTEAQANEWAATHDAEHHAEDDGNDDDYEKFKESRK